MPEIADILDDRFFRSIIADECRQPAAQPSLGQLSHTILRSIERVITLRSTSHTLGHFVGESVMRRGVRAPCG
jgi:hypothetical protein